MMFTEREDRKGVVKATSAADDDMSVLGKRSTVDDRFSRFEGLLQLLLCRGVQKECYTVQEFASMVGRRPFTVRQWCNLGRINAEKTMTKTGASTMWTIRNEEYVRFQHEGLLPPTRR